MLLNADNYAKGFLIDEELMGGITQHPTEPGQFVAYVLKHTTGEYLGYQQFSDLNEALAVLNRVQRPWKFESPNGCSSGSCNPENCKGGGCKLGQTKAAQQNGNPGASPCSTGACPT